jgi:hypothetical protein
VNAPIVPRVPAGELRMYRSLTFNLLRKYFRLSLSLGRLPSLVGRECFRTRYELQNHTFEDSVIFVHDMERCLARLDDVSKEMISLIVFQDFSWRQCARLMNCPLRTVTRTFSLGLDLLTKVMLRVGVIEPFACHQAGPQPPKAAKESAAHGVSRGFSVSVFHSPKGATETCQEPKIVKTATKLKKPNQI